jgi:hypothetical protein
MQTGSSGTLIGWKSGQTTFVPLWDRMEGAWLRTLSGVSLLLLNHTLRLTPFLSLSPPPPLYLSLPLPLPSLYLSLFFSFCLLSLKSYCCTSHFCQHLHVHYVPLPFTCQLFPPPFSHYASASIMFPGSNFHTFTLCFSTPLSTESTSNTLFSSFYNSFLDKQEK